MRSRGISRLYTHQAQAFDEVAAGRHVVVVTPTASGKTLCYNLPVLHAMLSDPTARALYLFPTKALSQDQVAELHTFIESLEIPIGTFTYDGDTPRAARKAVREKGHLVVTNPDMLHAGILPHHTRWQKIFENLRYVVIDEMHIYRGVFGSQVANVIRRLRRICRFYRSDPRFILASATIANPGDLARQLIEEQPVVIDENGAPRGRKLFALINPPVINEQLGIREGALSASRKLARRFLSQGHRTILFARTRLAVEVLTRYLKETLERRRLEDGIIRGYRGGYLPRVRRAIEKGLREGEILGVVSTNALELGIDIGHLEVAILAGYPGTIASTWQQSGRAGRRSDCSAAFLVASGHPLDQYVVRNPAYFFDRSPEHGFINADNLLILLSHIKCAAFELPFEQGERFGSENLEEILAFLEEQGVLHRAGRRWHWMQDSYPADNVSLRSASAENFLVVHREAGDKQIIAEVDFKSAALTLYPGAIYMVESESFVVEELDFENHRAYVHTSKADYYTEAIDYTRVRILDIFGSLHDGPALREHGEVHVLTHVSGFKKIKFYSAENVGYGEVNLPDSEMHTSAFWITLAEVALERLELPRTTLVDGIAGVAGAMRSVAALMMMCDVRDLQISVGDKSASWHTTQLVEPARKGRYLSRRDETWIPVEIDGLEAFEPTLFLYEAYPGGTGLAPEIHRRSDDLLQNTRELIANCACPSGCPSCVGPVAEGSERVKRTALKILEVLCGGHASRTDATSPGGES